MPNTVLVTTNWPSKADPVYTVLNGREEEMKRDHWNTLIRQGLHVRRFQRNRGSAWDIIGHLLQGIPTNPRQRNDVDNRDLQIQRELIDDGMAIPDTAAGQELRYTLKQLRKMLDRTGDREAGINLEIILATIGKLKDQLKRILGYLSPSRNASSGSNERS